MEFSDVDCKHDLEFKNNSIAKLKEELFLANKRIELLQRPSHNKRSKSQHRARSISRRLRSNSSGRTHGGKRRNKKHKKRRFTKSLY